MEDGTDATALAYAMLCSDFPELSTESLALLETALATGLNLSVEPDFDEIDFSQPDCSE